MKSMNLMSTFVLSGLFSVFSILSVPVKSQVKYTVYVYLCSDDDKLVWEDEKPKLEDSGVAFLEEEKEANDKCAVESFNCTNIEVCNNIIGTLEGKKIKIKSGLHSTDFLASLLSKSTYRIITQKGIKIFQLIDKNSKQILYQRRLYVAAPLFYSSTTKTTGQLGVKTFDKYKLKPNIESRKDALRSIFDRTSISIVIQKDK